MILEAIESTRRSALECFSSIYDYSFLLVPTAAGVFAWAQDSIVCFNQETHRSELSGILLNTFASFLYDFIHA